MNIKKEDTQINYIKLDDINIGYIYATYEKLDSFVSARGITEDEIQNFINSEVDNGKL